MVKYIVQPEDAIGRMEWHRAYVKYMVYKLEDEACNVTVHMVSVQGAEVLEYPPEGNSTIEAEWGGHYHTANKMIGACRGLYELGYFDIETEAIVYVGYDSAMSYIDYVSVFYKKGKVRKYRLPKMQYYAANMFMWGYDIKDLEQYNLKKFRDLIKISKKRRRGDGTMLTY